MKIKTLYANMIDRDGLYSLRPVTVKLENGNCWWDSTGYICVEKIGLDMRQGNCCIFASKNKQEVTAWTDGVRAAASVLQSFCANAK